MRMSYPSEIIKKISQFHQSNENTDKRTKNIAYFFKKIKNIEGKQKIQTSEGVLIQKNQNKMNHNVEKKMQLQVVYNFSFL